MDKLTRILLLYSKLIKGEQIDKALYCFENECSPRTFDRDIEVVRMFFSESFSFSELKYDKIQNTYYIEGAKRSFLEPVEYLFMERLLFDSEVLRNDEFSILLQHLLENTEGGKRFETEKNRICSTYSSPIHNRALIKMHGDLTRVIHDKKCIEIKYIKGEGDYEIYEIIPCKLEFDQGYIYLTGLNMWIEECEPSYYRVDRINSFEILRTQNSNEQKKVQSYIETYGGTGR